MAKEEWQGLDITTSTAWGGGKRVHATKNQILFLLCNNPTGLEYIDQTVFSKLSFLNQRLSIHLFYMDELYILGVC